MAGGRGRRVRPLDAQPERGDRACSRTSSSTTTRATARWRSCARRSASSWTARARRSCWDRPELLALREHGSLVALRGPARWTLTPGGSRFDWRGRTVALAVAGRPQRAERDRCAGGGAARGRAGDGRDRGARRFAGAGRRFELLGRSRGGALVYDDYAHHPTEVAATLAGARTLAPRRLVAVFQPHLYSRTASLAREFGAALARRGRGRGAGGIPGARARGGASRG